VTPGDLGTRFWRTALPPSLLDRNPKAYLITNRM
jgi:hypothetical protein